MLIMDYMRMRECCAEELLDLMYMIGQSVRASQFTATLASQILRLCQQLKISGECMEISHKSESPPTRTRTSAGGTSAHALQTR